MFRRLGSDMAGARRSLARRLRNATALNPVAICSLLGCVSAVPGTALAQQQCGAPDATGHVVCPPAVYPNGISYTAPTPFSLSLQQTATAAVSVADGGVGVVTSGADSAVLDRELSGAAGASGPSIVNTTGPGVSVSNSAGSVSIDLRDPESGAAGTTIRAFGNGVVATSGGNGGASVLLGSGAVTSLTGSGVDVISRGAVVVDTGITTVVAPVDGVSVQQTGASGSITVNTGAPISAAPGASGFAGILIGAGNTANTDPIQLNAAGSLTNETGGIRITSLGSRSVSVTTGTGALIQASQDGVNVSTAGAGVISVSTAANITGDTNSGTVGNAITLNSDAGAIHVITASGTTLSTNLGPFDVVAKTNSGDITFANGATLAGVNATGLAVTTAGGSIGLTSTGAMGAIGQPIRQAIFANVTGGAGALQITSSGAVVASGPVAIEAVNAGAGTSTLTFSGGSITALSGDAVRITGGAGAVAALVGSGVSLSGNSAIVEEGAGALTLSNAGTLTGDSLGQAVRVTPTGTITASLDNLAGGVVQGPGDTVSDAAVFVSGFGGVNLQNAGVIRATSTSDHSGVAVTSANNEPITITNASGATIDGRVVANAGVVSFTNAGSWFTNGQSTFGAMSTSAQRTLVNTGTLQVGATTGSSSSQTSIQGLDVTRNSGVISLANGIAGDTLTLAGNYVGAAPAQLILDVAPGKTALTTDTLHITGLATGATSVSLNLQGAPQFVPKTLLVQAAVGSSPDAFSLTGAASNAGLLQYAIVYDAGSGAYFLVSRPSAVAAEFAQLAEIRQNLWFETSQAVTNHLEQLRDEQGASADRVNTGVYFWNNVVGGVHDRSLTQNMTYEGMPVSYDQGYHQSYVGDQLGAEVTQQFFYSSATLGVTGGYVSSSARFDSTHDTLSLGQFNIGAYAAYNSPFLFVSGLAKADFGHQTIDGNAGFDRTLDTRQFGVTLLVGRRFEIGRWFVEPLASLNYLHGYVAGGDTTTLPGGDEQQNNFDLLGASVAFPDDNAARGQFAVRLGAETLTWRGLNLRPFVDLSINDDFLGSDKVIFTFSDTDVPFASDRDSPFGAASVGLTLLANARCRLEARAGASFGDGLVSGGGNLVAQVRW